MFGTLIISDLHVPYHDPLALDMVCKVIRLWRPDQIIINGDLGDFYSLSTFDRNPDRVRKGNFQDELDAIHRVLHTLVSAGSAARIRFIPGNHEDRLRRYLWRHPELHGLRALELSRLLIPATYGIEYSEETIFLADGALGVFHGDAAPKGAGNAAHAALAKTRYSHSVAVAHNHRVATVMVTTPKGPLYGLEGGCLCDIAAVSSEFAPFADWQQGFILVLERPGTPIFHAEAVPILPGPAVFLEGTYIPLHDPDLPPKTT